MPLPIGIGAGIAIRGAGKALAKSKEGQKDVRNTMRETEERIDAAMRQLDKDISEKLQEALDNPLNE